MKKLNIKPFAIYALIVLFFAALSFAFTPDVLDGKVLDQPDASHWKGMSHEISQWNKQHPDDKTLWTGSMFGGMPTVGMYDDFDGDYTKPLYQALMSFPRPVSFMFIALLGGFLLMLSFGVNRILSVAGAVAIAFCSYNMQIIQVGHNSKMQAIAFMTWVLAAVVYTYRQATTKTDIPLKKRLPSLVGGSALFALALGLQIKANHVQISYYLAWVILFYVLAVFVSLFRRQGVARKEAIRRFFLASALLLVMGTVGIATNANKLIPTYNYTQYTMRGGSELSSDSDSHNKTGLDLEYATQWSYGIEEMPNLMIPNFRGGISTGLSKDSQTYKVLRQAGHPEYISYFQEYWGPQPFTAGPMYLGAVCCFLFILGLFLFKGKEKWWLLAATLLATFLAWGNHFMAFTRFFFEYVPMYSKFRSVSMALTVLQISVPLLGFLVLDKIIKEGYSRKDFSVKAWVAYALTGGFCLLCWVLPSIAGAFLTEAEMAQPEFLLDALVEDRIDLLVADARRSFFLISITFAMLWWLLFSQEKKAANGKKYSRVSLFVMTAVSVLVLVDLFSVGKRYLSEDSFVTPKVHKGQFAPREVDRLIHQDKDLSYRVLDLSVNTFNDAFQSYHHKCIGGYSPVKLQRYQDLIDRYISKEISQAGSVLSQVATLTEFEEKMPSMPVVSMLNGRYVVVQGNMRPAVNKQAFGNAWFVSQLCQAATPDEEIAMLGKVDLRACAVVGADYWSQLKNPDALASAASEIALSSYAPNEMHYQFKSGQGGLAVFSEIFHPIGWKAVLNYTPAGSAESVSCELPLLRANWILRAAELPAGEGEIIMRYEPADYILGANISRASSILLYLLLILSCAWGLAKKSILD